MVKLKTAKIIIGSMANFKTVGSLHVLQKPLTVELFIRRLIAKHDGIHVYSDKVYLMHFDKGYACDGLSVPKAFRWFLPSWDKKNGDYNLAGVVHDALYGNSGFGTFTREECDDIFRGLLRESGINRFKAGMADKCVELFAPKHFGSDELKVANLVTLEEI